MFPPLEPGLLEQNPDFSKLYRTLTTVVLDPDGTTKNDDAARQRAAVKEELDEHRLRAAQRHLLRHALSTATPASSSSSTKPRTHSRTVSQPQPAPSDALLDLLHILPPLLSPDTTLCAEDAALLLSSPPLADLEHHLPDLAGLVSTQLHAAAVGVARTAHPGTNPSFAHRRIASLPQHAADLRADLEAAQASLAAERAAALSDLTTLLDAHARTQAQLVGALEAKHGPVAQGLELRAHETALLARRGAHEANAALTQLRDEVYSPEIVAAMRNYLAHLRDARVRATEKVRSREAELAEYGVGSGGPKEKTMREIARVYRDVARQVEDVKRDLERLDK